jgi:hypothetical protein
VAVVSESNGSAGANGTTAEVAGEHVLRFRILAIHGQRDATSSPPWHEPGGTWTFADAVTLEGIAFGFAIEGPQGRRAMLTVPSRDAGARLVDAFARFLRGGAPSAKPPEPLSFTPFPVVVLSTDSSREPDGRFRGKGGGWITTKLFLQRRGFAGELYLNFQPNLGEGEFAPKEDHYTHSVLAFLAAELRDGPRPPRPARMPENDLTLTSSGPRIAWIRSLPFTRDSRVERSEWSGPSTSRAVDSA